MAKDKDSWYGMFGDRFNSTIFVTFIFYIILFNWQIVMYLINTNLITEEMLLPLDDNINDRVDYIANLILVKGVFWKSIGYTIVSVLLFPVINGLVSAYKKFIRSHRDNVNKAIESKYFKYSKDEFIKLKKEFHELQESQNIISASNNQLISSNQELIESKKQLTIQLNDLKDKQSELKDEIILNKNLYQAELNKIENIKSWEANYLSFSESTLFKYFEDVGRYVTSGTKNLPFDRIIIERFMGQNILTNYALSNGKPKYSFTEKGQYFWNKYLESLSFNKGQNLEFFGDKIVELNVKDKDTDKFTELLSSDPGLKKINSIEYNFEEIENGIHIIIFQVNTHFYNYLQIVLKSNDIEYSELKFRNY